MSRSDTSLRSPLRHPRPPRSRLRPEPGGVRDPNASPEKDPRPGWGRYYQYDTPNGSRVIAEHTADPNAPHPHFHAGKPQEGLPSDVNMQGKTYKQIMPKHHIYYAQERCLGK
ncbi:HNH/endonuclease VII fold putative polymorphic toxin [Streptomyces sp. NPDC001816]|uniref:HNH/endonuclease VII fold putative polymorphic toxin n=1 Tax=Streptomyces sp. NPDC001816 TaxID=3364612 RepID=UPI0036BF4AC1